MTTNVTIHETDGAGARLLKLETQVFLDRPGLDRNSASDRAFVRHLVREANPDLTALHHAGLQAEPEPTVNPGELLADKAHRLLTSGAARTFTEAVELAHKALPAAAAAYQTCRLLPADQADRAPEADPPPRQLADPGRELMRLVTERMAGDATLTVEAAQKVVLASDPILARHYSTAKPLPLGPRPSARELAVEEALVHCQKLNEELAALRMSSPGARRHFSELTQAEQRRHLPERRIGPNEQPQPGEVVVHRMSKSPDGGTFAVMEG